MLGGMVSVDNASCRSGILFMERAEILAACAFCCTRQQWNSTEIQSHAGLQCKVGILVQIARDCFFISWLCHVLAHNMRHSTACAIRNKPWMPLPFQQGAPASQSPSHLCTRMSQSGVRFPWLALRGTIGVILL